MFFFSLKVTTNYSTVWHFCLAIPFCENYVSNILCQLICPAGFNKLKHVDGSKKNTFIETLLVSLIQNHDWLPTSKCEEEYLAPTYVVEATEREPPKNYHLRLTSCNLFLLFIIEVTAVFPEKIESIVYKYFLQKTLKIQLLRNLERNYTKCCLMVTPNCHKNSHYCCNIALKLFWLFLVKKTRCIVTNTEKRALDLFPMYFLWQDNFRQLQFFPWNQRNQWLFLILIESVTDQVFFR